MKLLLITYIIIKSEFKPLLADTFSTSKLRIETLLLFFFRGLIRSLLPKWYVFKIPPFVERFSLFHYKYFCYFYRYFSKQLFISTPFIFFHLCVSAEKKTPYSPPLGLCYIFICDVFVVIARKPKDMRVNRYIPLSKKTLV